MNSSGRQGRGRQARPVRDFSGERMSSTTNRSKPSPQAAPAPRSQPAGQSMPSLDLLFALDDGTPLEEIDTGSSSKYQQQGKPTGTVEVYTPPPHAASSGPGGRIGTQLIPARPQPPQTLSTSSGGGVHRRYQPTQQQQQQPPPPPVGMRGRSHVTHKSGGNIPAQRALPAPQDPPASAAAAAVNTCNALVPVTTAENNSEATPSSLPIYHVVFNKITREHKNLAFVLPKHFYDYFNAPAAVNTTKVLLFKYNQRALAMEVEMSIFGEFVCRLLHQLIIIWRVQYHVEIQDAPPDWIARYKKGAVVNYENFERLSRRVALAINCSDTPPTPAPVGDRHVPDPISIYITAQRNHLLVMLTWDADAKPATAPAQNYATVGSQTDFLVLPSYYMDMLRDQIAAITLSDIRADEGFFAHRDVITSVEGAQASILEHVASICDKFDASLQLHKEILDGDAPVLQFSTSKEVQTEDMLMADDHIMHPKEFPPADAIFDVYEEHLAKVLRYSVAKFKACAATLLEKEAEYRLLRKEHSSHRETKKSSSTSSSADAKHRSDERKKRSPSNGSNKENRDERNKRSSESRSRSVTTSTSKRRKAPEKPATSGDEQQQAPPSQVTIDLAGYLDGLRAILAENSLTRNVPPPEPPSLALVKEDLQSDAALKNNDVIYPDDFMRYLGDIDGVPIKFDTKSEEIDQTFPVPQDPDNFIPDYDMCY